MLFSITHCCLLSKLLSFHKPYNYIHQINIAPSKFLFKTLKILQSKWKILTLNDSNTNSVRIVISDGLHGVVDTPYFHFPVFRCTTTNIRLIESQGWNTLFVETTLCFIDRWDDRCIQNENIVSCSKHNNAFRVEIDDFTTVPLRRGRQN